MSPLFTIYTQHNINIFNNLLLIHDIKEVELMQEGKNKEKSWEVLQWRKTVSSVR